MIYFIGYIIIALISAIISEAIFDNIETTAAIGILWPIVLVLLIVAGLVFIFIQWPSIAVKKHIVPKVREFEFIKKLKEFLKLNN